ncbi:MAG: hypothetical protein EOQ42_12375 [Mesorhizobium sp.]|uniref:O-antigen ligase family protein n=1 Tax=Mesorhizobium sp. TaxID=1871066 RepID=UPI000FE4E3A7|nr:hypothetical protein [Mesorhizobium sp.]RWB34104.1 MAG: hypothetical protein EOQ43_00065 [Mesorhizobium sp.]RWB69643.1 MAG: hypothetical protein EOQ42_12375 [Mesorhizobium sp.]RWD18460.1 MAG: hypothetical protein EOS57_17065 [Mesorhizobium sp.]
MKFQSEAHRNQALAAGPRPGARIGKSSSLSVDRLMLVALVGPAVAGVFRKLTPTQPVQIEALPVSIFLALVFFGLVKVNKNQPSVAYGWIVSWIALVAIYAVPAFAIDTMLGIQALLLGAGTPMLGLAFLTYGRPGDSMKLVRAAKIFVSVIALQFPLGIVMLVFGNDALPSVFRANAIEVLAGKEFRIGQATLAGYFTTAPVNSIASLCAFGFASALVLRSRSSKERLVQLAIALMILAVIWMTARRGALFSAIVIAFILLAIEIRVHRGRLIFALFAASPVAVFSLALFWDRVNSVIFGERMVLLSEGQLDIGERINTIFLKFVVEWINLAPFGNFTGYASGAGKAFEVRDLSMAAEVGAAMIVAENGVLGLILFTAIFIILQIEMIRRIRKTGQYWCGPLVTLHFVLFALFFFKENSVLFPGLIGSLCYWSLPGLVAVGTSEIASPGYWRTSRASADRYGRERRR